MVTHVAQAVDSADLARLEDCKAELHSLLGEERLFGATLLIFANKQDIPSALPVPELEQVRAPAVCLPCLCSSGYLIGTSQTGLQNIELVRHLSHALHIRERNAIAYGFLHSG